jgi:predicted dehydrogenase
MLYYLLGEFKSVSAKMQTAYPQRMDRKGESRQVEVEDAAYLIAEMKHGASGTVQVSKIATGTKRCQTNLSAARDF